MAVKALLATLSLPTMRSTCSLPRRQGSPETDTPKQLMKAFVCRQWGDPSVLRYEDIAPPPLRPGNIRVEVHAADIGFHDVLMLAGKYQVKPPFPFIPGAGVAGIVRECGESLRHLAVGDRVVARLPAGGFAEEAIVPAGAAVKVPDTVGFSEAVVLSAPYSTAYQGLVDRGNIVPGEVLLVRGAGGGVGRAAVVIGHAMGAVVIAAASSAEKLDEARLASADYLINTSVEDVRGRVLEITEGRGADVIFDPVGADFKQACLRSIARRGRILIVGFAGGEIPEIPAHYVLNKFCAVIGVYWGYSEKEAAHYQEILAEVLRMRSEGRIPALPIRTIGPERVISALNALSSRSSVGSTVMAFDRTSSDGRGAFGLRADARSSHFNSAKHPEGLP